jgi:hypothetical protein
MQKYGLLSEWQAKKRLFFLVDEHEADLQGYKKRFPAGMELGCVVTSGGLKPLPRQNSLKPPRDN